MSFNFPNTPTDGQTFQPITGGPTYAWNAATGAWKLSAGSAGGGAGGGLYVGDTPPTNQVPGMLWWESDTGSLYVWYADPDSSQWVMVVPGTAGTPPVAGDLDMRGYSIINDLNITGTGAATFGGIITGGGNFQSSSANAILGTTGAGTIWLRPNGIGSTIGQTTIDPSGNMTVAGTGGNVLTTANSPTNGAGYAKLASGLVVNWGAVSTNSNGDVNINFPAAFPNANLGVSAMINTGSSVPVGNYYGATVCNLTGTGCSFQARQIIGTGGPAGQAVQVRYIAIGM
jgi:hypothetical protein